MLAYAYNSDDALVELVWRDEVYIGGRLIAIIAGPN